MQVLFSLPMFEVYSGNASTSTSEISNSIPEAKEAREGGEEAGSTTGAASPGAPPHGEGAGADEGLLLSRLDQRVMFLPPEGVPAGLLVLGAPQAPSAAGGASAPPSSAPQQQVRVSHRTRYVAIPCGAQRLTCAARRMRGALT